MVYETSIAFFSFCRGASRGGGDCRPELGRFQLQEEHACNVTTMYNHALYCVV